MATKKKASARRAVVTTEDLYERFDRQLREFQGEIRSEVLFLDINFDHRFEMGWSEWASFGMYWIASLCNTGHEHLALLPTFGRPPDAWPVAFYDEQEGVATTFSTSVRTWFPSYLIHLTEQKHAARRQHFATYADELAAHCKKHFDFDAGALIAGRASGKLKTSMAYEMTEAGSYLHRYWQLREAKDKKGMKKLAHELPFFNAPLFWLLESKAADEDDCWEIFHRTFRFDMGTTTSEVHKRAARKIKKRAKGTPFESMVKRLLAGEDYWRGAEGFFAVGEHYERTGELGKAFSAFENAYYMERCETEEVNTNALKRLDALAKKIGDKSYLSYLAEADMKGRDGDA